MARDIHFRIKVRAQMSVRPGWIAVEPLPIEVKPGIVRLGPHIPKEIPLDLLPPDLRAIGSTFWMLFDQRREPVGFERISDVAKS